LAPAGPTLQRCSRGKTGIPAMEVHSKVPGGVVTGKRRWCFHGRPFPRKILSTYIDENFSPMFFRVGGGGIGARVQHRAIIAALARICVDLTSLMARMPCVSAAKKG